MGDLSGTVTLSGSPVQGATVWVIDTTTDTVVATDTSDVNGDWSVSVAGGNERYHALVQYESGGTKYNAESLPFLSTPATLSPVATDVEFQTPTATVENVNAIPDSGVSRWTFDDADTSGSTAVDIWDGNDGTINGATTGVTGQYAEAYDFDGVDDYVSLLDLSLSSASSFSIALWVNLDATGDQRFLGRYDGSADLLEFGINSDSNFFANLGHAGGSTLRPVGTGVAGSTWVMVTLVYDASGPSATIYQNDTQDASDSGSLNDFADGSGPDIGRRSDGGSHVDGRIDDPRLYDKALSSTEVSNLYNNGDIRG